MTEPRQGIRARRRLEVTGVVQGVGFRPFVYTLARRQSLAGHVGNNSAGVFIEIEGFSADLDLFQRYLLDEAPPLSHIERVIVHEIEPLGDDRFEIVLSEGAPTESTLISPDVSICTDCLRETLDPTDRRFRYPFTNCTNCGPRFSIIRDIPYDRPLTTMAPFTMCSVCQAEYDDPLDRRFHAQPNACPVCGPQVWLEGSGSRQHLAERAEALRAAQNLLAEGRILAIKGVGGFHLACDATSDAALRVLRERKGRVDKPFAIMAADADTVYRFARLAEAELALLVSKERPIVLLDKSSQGPLSELIAPGNHKVGVMLPYTPLHYLLFQDLALDAPVLVMTSANYSNEPIVSNNQEAREKLAGLADALLMHDRAIEARCDDSVVLMWRGNEVPVRRSRGYAPFPVRLPFTAPPILAVGGELKATFCLTKREHAYLSQHIGDMENLETLQAFEDAVAHFKHVFRVDNKYIACDRHPGYLSTRWALEQENAGTVLQVQHHHAHIASVMAENGISSGERVIGVGFDGTGYGDDGAIWGGELLLATYDDFERLAHLKYMPLPGGDAAIKRPYRLALAYLWRAGILWDDRLAPVLFCPDEERQILLRQLETGLNTVPTSSMGRLFDVVAALAGVRQQVTYEAQAAIELESQIDETATGAYCFEVSGTTVDPGLLLEAVVADVLSGEPAGTIAARFHRAVADLVWQLAERTRAQTGLNIVALSGGVFQNVALLEMIVRRLEEADFNLLLHQKVPANDGGLALGQAAIAACIIATEGRA